MTRTTPVYNPLGREPLQKRSIERIELILTITNELIQELPLEEINTNLIAKRAGIKPGTLYHFFPNKYAIYNALLHRAMTQMDAVFVDIFDNQNPDDAIEKDIENAIFKLAEFWSNSTLLTSIWFFMQRRPETLQMVEYFESLWIPKLAKELIEDIPQLKPERAELAAFIILQTIYPLLDQSALLSPQPARLLLTESSKLLASYIDSLRTMPPEKTESLNRQAKKFWRLKNNQQVG